MEGTTSHTHVSKIKIDVNEARIRFVCGRCGEVHPKSIAAEELPRDRLAVVALFNDFACANLGAWHNPWMSRMFDRAQQYGDGPIFAPEDLI